MVQGYKGTERSGCSTLYKGGFWSRMQWYRVWYRIQSIQREVGQGEDQGTRCSGTKYRVTVEKSTWQICTVYMVQDYRGIGYMVQCTWYRVTGV